MSKMRQRKFSFCNPISHNISHVCLSNGCDEKFLCTKCRPSHNGFHSSHIKQIQDVLDFDGTKKAKEIKDNLVFIGSQAKKIKEQREDITEKIKKEIENLIQKTMVLPYKEEVIEEVKPGKELDSLSTELETLKTEYMSNDNSNDSKTSILSQYIKKYKTFQDHASKITKNTKENAWASLTHKKLEVELTILFSKVEEALGSFMEECFGSCTVDNNPEVQDMELSLSLREQQEKKERIQIKKEKTIDLTAPTRWDSIDYIEKQDLIVIGNELGNIEVWKASEMKLISAQKQHQAAINALKYYQKGDCMITASDDTTIKVSKIETMPVIDTVSTLKEHKDKVWSLLVVEEHDILYSSGKEACVIGWDLKTMKMKYKLDTNGKDTTGTQMAFIPRLNLLAVSFKKGWISLYDIGTPSQEIRSIKVLDKWLHALTYIESRDELIVGTDVGVIKVWKVGNYIFQPVKQHKVVGGIPTAILPINNDKELLVTSGCNKLVSVDLDSGVNRIGVNRVVINSELEKIQTFKVFSSIKKILLCSDKTSLIAGSY